MAFGALVVAAIGCLVFFLSPSDIYKIDEPNQTLLTDKKAEIESEIKDRLGVAYDAYKAGTIEDMLGLKDSIEGIEKSVYKEYSLDPEGEKVFIGKTPPHGSVWFIWGVSAVTFIVISFSVVGNSKIYKAIVDRINETTRLNTQEKEFVRRAIETHKAFYEKSL